MYAIIITVIICVTALLCTAIFADTSKANWEVRCGVHGVTKVDPDLAEIQAALDKEYQDLKVPTFDAIMGAINEIESEMDV